MNNAHLKPRLFSDTSHDASVWVLRLVWLYALAIAGAEIVLVHVDVVAGFVIHCLLIVLLLSHYAVVSRSEHWRILPVLALLPLLRVYSLAMAIHEWPEVYWYVTAGIPLLISAFYTVRLLGLSADELGLSMPAGPSAWLAQIGIVLSGVPLSWLAFSLWAPEALVDTASVVEAVIGAAILAVFAGFAEELIFRGLLRPLSDQIAGRAGVLLTNGLFAVMYLGALSLPYAIFMGVSGTFWGWCVGRTHSLWGVILAHSVFSVLLLTVWP